MGEDKEENSTRAESDVGKQEVGKRCPREVERKEDEPEEPEGVPNGGDQTLGRRFYKHTPGRLISKETTLKNRIQLHANENVTQT